MKKLILLFLILNSTISLPQWQNTGPWSGKVNALSANGYVYYAASGKKIYKTSSLKNHWDFIYRFDKDINCLLALENKLYVGSIGLKISLDGGISFSNDSFVGNREVHFISCFKGKIICGTESGLFLSDSLENSLNSVQLNDKNIYSFSTSPSEIYFGTNKGIYKSTDLINYFKVGNNTPDYISKLLVTNDQQIICTNSYQFYYSEDQNNFQTKNYDGNTNYVCLGKQQSKLYMGIYKERDYRGELLESSDGISWSSNKSFPSTSAINDILTKGDTLIILSDGGIIYSFDEGLSWENSSIGIGGRVTAVVKNSQYMFCAVAGAGVFFSSDNGLSWLPTVTPILCPEVRDLLIFKEQIFAATMAGLIQSSDNGKTWKLASLKDQYLWALTSNQNEIFAVGYSGFSYSADLFKTYSFMDGCFYSIWLDGNNIILGGDGFIISSNDRKNWVTNSLYKQTSGTSPVLGLVKNGNEIFLGTYNYNGVFYSNDGGNNFESIINGLDNHTVFTLKLINGKIWCGTDGWNGGIFEWDPTQNSWKKVVIPELSNPPICKINYLDNKIFIGTWFDGLWYEGIGELKYYNEISQNNELPQQYMLEQNYPNPFNPRTKIKYHIPQAGRVQMKIYDILGREVITLFDEEKNPGNYDVEFDGSNLSSGIYFYKLISGDSYEIKKMVVLK